MTDWYDVDADNFIKYVEDFHETFQRPIWVTEWDCQNFNDKNAQCSYNDIVSFLNKTQTFLDETDYVERYAWFGAMRNMQGVNPVSNYDKHFCIRCPMFFTGQRFNGLGRRHQQSRGSVHQ
jgi:hypothetical protein